MNIAPSAAKQTATWLTQMKEEIEAHRPGGAWFAATFHPCCGQRRDMERGVGEAEERLRRFDGRVAQLLFGGRWMNRPARMQRPWAVLIGQNGVEGFHFHFHGLLAVPHEHADRFLKVAPAAWRELAPFGSLDMPALKTVDDWSAYATRQIRLGQSVHFVALPYVNEPRQLPFTLH